jgi:hypothetical protein
LTPADAVPILLAGGAERIDRSFVLFLTKERLMRRILTLLVILAFWSLPMAEAKVLRPFQPPSPKKMMKTPLVQKDKPAGEEYNGKQKAGLLGRCR